MTHKTMQHSPENTLGLIIDPVHGPIRLEDDITGGTDVIRRLLKTRMLMRLRGIKQLGFASYCFPAADHTRFAHALGTMQVMRRLIAKQLSHTSMPELRETIKGAFPHFKRYGRKVELDKAIATHVYVAGLLQDVGELPFAQATEVYFLPRAEEIRKLTPQIPIQAATGLETKEFFTLLSIKVSLEDDSVLRAHLDFQFLAYLIAGVWPGCAEAPAIVRPLAHMLDGVVDADRLDYVARDARNTLGTALVPSTVIEDLLCYEIDGPVFRESEPVIAFLTDYAQLWSSVYFAPENRFRVCVLATLLQETKQMGIGHLRAAHLGTLADQLDAGITHEDFLDFDDRQVLHHLGELGRSNIRSESKRLDQALSILLDEKDCREFDALWVKPPIPPLSGKAPDFGKWLGGAVFYDAFFQVGRHTLYSKVKKPAFVRSHLLSPARREIPLHELDGPFSGLFKDNEWQFSKQPDSVLVFFPSKKNNRENVVKHTSNKEFYQTVHKSDPLRSRCSSDTRHLPNHGAPGVFISYESTDVQCVYAVCERLYTARRQYYFLHTSSCLGGVSTKEQSIQFAGRAEVALILLSKKYLEKFSEGERSQDGNIWNEVKVLVRRKKEQKVHIRFLTPDGFDEVKNYGAFPLAELAGCDPKTFRLTDIPSMAPSIRTLAVQDLAKAVREILEGLPNV